VRSSWPNILGLSCCLVIASCSAEPVPTGPATDEAIAAIALPEPQLRTFLVGAGLGTHSGPMFIYDLGSERGCAALGEAVDEAVHRHLPAWRANLVAAYRENVPANELARAVQSNPRAAQRQLRKYLVEIGRSMKSKSSELFKQAAVQVLSRMSDEAAKTDRSKINRAAREMELREAMKSKSVCKEVRDRAESVDA
jgi:hypothetical protein